MKIVVDEETKLQENEATSDNDFRTDTDTLVTLSKCEVECQTEVFSTDVCVQVGSPGVTVIASASCQTETKPDITVEDLENHDDKTRFYTGFINFAMFMLMFNCLKKHGAEKLNYWEGEKKSMGPKPYMEGD